MSVDTSIYNALMQPRKSAMDYAQEYKQADTANALQQIQLDQARQGQADEQVIRNALSGAGGSQSDQIGALMGSGNLGAIKQGQAMQAAQIKAAQDAAQTQKARAETGKTEFETRMARTQQHLGQLATVTDVDGAMRWLDEAQASGELPADRVALAKQRIQQDPNSLGQWKQQAMMGGMKVAEQLQMTAPKPHEIDLGDRKVLVDMNPQSATYGKHLQSMAKQASPDALVVAGSQAAQRAQQDRQFKIKNEREDAQNSADNSPDGDMEAVAQAIASGRLPPPTGAAAMMPKNQKLMARVMGINPEYDAATMQAKIKAAKDFTSGPQGNALRSVSTANAHLDQLGALADEMTKGNIPGVNRVVNWYKTQTGDPEVTNFNSIKSVVGQEVVKAIVAGGGGVGEREEAARMFADASSPEQIKGVIKHFRHVMQAQADNLMAQRRAAGLSDDTLPDYSGKGAKKDPSGGATKIINEAQYKALPAGATYIAPDGQMRRKN